MNLSEAIRILKCDECVCWFDPSGGVRKKYPNMTCAVLPENQVIEQAELVRASKMFICQWKARSFDPSINGGDIKNAE